MAQKSTVPPQEHPDSEMQNIILELYLIVEFDINVLHVRQNSNNLAY